MPKTTSKKKRKHQSQASEKDDATNSPAAKVRRKDKSLLDHIGFTTYASKLIYTVTELRKFVQTESSPTKRWLGLIPIRNDNVITFKKPELVFGQPDDDGLVVISPRGLVEFLRLNESVMEVNEDGTFSRKLTKSTVEGKRKADRCFQSTLGKLSRQVVDIVAFDDKFQASELVYGIGVNHSFRRVVVVFRGSVMGNWDWPTNFRYHPISIIESLARRVKSKYLSIGDLEKIGADVKIHFGFAKYLFGALSKQEDHGRYNSKFDKIAATLESLYAKTDRKGNLLCEGYELIVSGHSLGGALAQLLTFALGASEKCRETLPQPITGVTYASPCVGNAAFSKSMHQLLEKKIAQHIRITHQGDVVPVGYTTLGYGYTQTGCNLHVAEGEIVKLGGFGNTQTTWNQRSSEFGTCHSMPSYTDALYWKKKDGKVNGNSKVWAWDIDTVLDCVKQGKDILDLPRPMTLWTVNELKQELRSRNLKVSGNKAELIARLERSKASNN
jgi:hypothetical protein